MDADTFDDWVKRLTATESDRLAASPSAPGSRRALLRLVTALPLTGLLTTVLTEAGEAGGRQKRREKRHTPRAGEEKAKNKKPKKKCASAGQATSKKRKQCCAGLAKDAAGRCAEPPRLTSSSPACTPVGVPPTPAAASRMGVGARSVAVAARAPSSASPVGCASPAT